MIFPKDSMILVAAISGFLQSIFSQKDVDEKRAFLTIQNVIYL